VSPEAKSILAWARVAEIKREALEAAATSNNNKPIVVRGPNFVVRIERTNGLLHINVKSWRARGAK
jgi:hypothetical protein